MFVVLPYILYVARAFSTLEGIGLSANEDYSIVSPLVGQCPLPCLRTAPHLPPWTI